VAEEAGQGAAVEADTEEGQAAEMVVVAGEVEAEATTAGVWVAKGGAGAEVKAAGNRRSRPCESMPLAAERRSGS